MEDDSSSNSDCEHDMSEEIKILTDSDSDDDDDKSPSETTRIVPFILDTPSTVQRKSNDLYKVLVKAVKIHRSDMEQW